jgi:hypothetical protein
MWCVDAYQIPYYSRGIEGAKRTHPRFADCRFCLCIYHFSIADEGKESADIATNENILLLDEYSKVKLFKYLLHWRFPKVVPMGAIVIRTRYDEGTELADSVPSSKTNIFQNKLIYCCHFRTYSRCAMFDWSDTVFQRRNVTRRHYYWTNIRKWNYLNASFIEDFRK